MKEAKDNRDIWQAFQEVLDQYKDVTWDRPIDLESLANKERERRLSSHIIPLEKEIRRLKDLCIHRTVMMWFACLGWFITAFAPLIF